MVFENWKDASVLTGTKFVYERNNQSFSDCFSLESGYNIINQKEAFYQSVKIMS